MFYEDYKKYDIFRAYFIVLLFFNLILVIIILSRISRKYKLQIIKYILQKNYARHLIQSIFFEFSTLIYMLFFENSIIIQ